MTAKELSVRAEFENLGFNDALCNDGESAATAIERWAGEQ